MMTHPIAWLRELGNQLREQDNAASAHPLYLVERRRRIYGLNWWYTEGVAWLDSESEVDEEMFRKLEEDWLAEGVEPNEYTRTGYLDLWEHVTTCMTREAAEEYIRRERHNLPEEVRVWVASAHRNPEMIALREALLGLATYSALDNGS